jgi:pimeloyl-ACP methyl ester carboxylesterase
MSASVGLTVLGCLVACLPAFPSAHSEGPVNWRTTDLTFKSADGVVLAGSFIKPMDTSPVAAVVLIHGSGPAERYTALGTLMALRGIAVLTYDKRGVGQSGGRYEGGDNVSRANLQLLASDASSAMTWLANKSQYRQLPRGFIGISQAGWIVPLALSKTTRVDFIAFWSGPTCTTSEQFHFQRFSETRGYDRSRFTEADIAHVMQHVAYRSDDTDPLDALIDVSIPGLWLFGRQDPYVPIDLSIGRLQALIDKGHPNFSYRIFVSEGHNLADSAQQESFDAMVEWVRRKALDKTRLQ